MTRGLLGSRPAAQDWAKWLDQSPADPPPSLSATYAYNRAFEAWLGAMPDAQTLTPPDKQIVRSELLTMAHFLALSVRSSQSFGLMSLLGAVLSFLGIAVLPEQRTQLAYFMVIMLMITSFLSYRGYRRQKLLAQCNERIGELLR